MGQKKETFCEIIVQKQYSNVKNEVYTEVSLLKKSFWPRDATIKEIARYSTAKYHVTVNYGDGVGWQQLKTDNSDDYTCDSQAEVLNYFSNNGWKLIRNFKDRDVCDKDTFRILLSKMV